MNARFVPLFLALVPLVLAGCTSPKQDVQPQATAPPTPAAPSDPTAPAPPPSAPPPSSTPPTPAPPTPAPPNATRIKTLSSTFHADVGTATPTPGTSTVPPSANGSSGAAYGEAPAKLVVEESQPAVATLVATWTASTPAAASLHARLTREPPASGAVATDGGAVIASGAGASPLKIQVPVGSLTDGTYYVTFSTDAPGLAVKQDVAVVLTLEYR